MFIWDNNYLYINHKITTSLPHKQASHRLSYLVGGIIFREKCLDQTQAIIQIEVCIDNGARSPLLYGAS